jgi:hypothetical protein
MALLQREPHECLSDVTQTYLRDVYDHLVQLIDLVETYRHRLQPGALPGRGGQGPRRVPGPPC